jgi:hypothetical protein
VVFKIHLLDVQTGTLYLAEAGFVEELSDPFANAL